MKSKIIKNIGRAGYNFDFRVVKIMDINKDKTVTTIDGELNSYCRIIEVWYGEEGTIVAYTSPEELYATSPEDMKVLLNEYLEDACSQPVLNFEFVKEQCRLNKLKFNRDWKKMSEEERVEYLKGDVVEKETEDFKSIEDRWDEFMKDYTPPVYEHISKKEAIKRFKLKEYEV